jgi:hypothetical protein
VLPQDGEVGFDDLLSRAEQLGQLRGGRLAAERKQGEQMARAIATEVGTREANAPGPDLEATEELDLEHDSELCV